MTAEANVGVVGLAAMGASLARNLARHGNKVAVFNRHYSRTEKLITEHGSEGEFFPAKTMEEFVASLKKPRTAIIMVKAGEPTDAMIDQLADLMEPGDIIVDAGNAHFPDTIRREKAISARGLHFVGCGVSGGEEGALLGPSMMPGGSEESWKTLKPIFESIAAKAEGEPCVTHIGENGAGHFVKMVHNGIEYSDMQLISESYDLMRRALGMTPAEIGDVFEEWNKTELDSYLIEITAEVLHQVDKKTGKPLVDLIVDHAGMKGTGTWTVQTALSLAVPVTGIAEAVFARGLSSEADLREEAQKQGFAGPDGKLNLNDDEKKVFIDKVRERTVKRLMMVITLVTFIPSVVIGFHMVRVSVFEAVADKYVSQVFNFPHTRVIECNKHYAQGKNPSQIELLLVGEPLGEEIIGNARAQLYNYGLQDLLYMNFLI